MTLEERIPVALKVRGEPLTIPELVEETGYSNPSVRRACRKLLRRRELVLAEGRPWTPGLKYGLPAWVETEAETEADSALTVQSPEGPEPAVESEPLSPDGPVVEVSLPGSAAGSSSNGALEAMGWAESVPEPPRKLSQITPAKRPPPLRPRILEALKDGPLTFAELRRKIGCRNNGSICAVARQLELEGRLTRNHVGSSKPKDGNGTEAVYALRDEEDREEVVRPAPPFERRSDRCPVCLEELPDLDARIEHECSGVAPEVRQRGEASLTVPIWTVAL